jgi:hypothetical protein
LDVYELECEAIRTRLRLLAAGAGLRFQEGVREGGFQVLLSSEEDPDEVYVAVCPRGGGYVSLSILLVVDEAFFRTSVESILEVISRFDICPSLLKDHRLEEGEIYLSLSLRVFFEGLGTEVFGMALANLKEAREALAAAFP